MFKIGTLADWFGVGLIEGIRESQRCGASGVQIYAWNELNPYSVSHSELTELKSVARECGQEITALCGEIGGHGLARAEDNQTKLEYLKKTVDMAVTLECNVVTTHIGCIPEDANSAGYRTMLEACSEIGGYANEKGVYIAVETGPEPVERLVGFIKACGKGMAINYDPANLVMVTGDDEVQGVYTGGRLIVHTHAKDGKCNVRVPAEHVYSIFAEGDIEALTKTNYFTEYPLGQGDVRWPEYLRALRDIGYRGYLTIEREVSQDAGKDIKMAVDFLRKQLEQIFETK